MVNIKHNKMMELYVNRYPNMHACLLCGIDTKSLKPFSFRLGIGHPSLHVISDDSEDLLYTMLESVKETYQPDTYQILYYGKNKMTYSKFTNTISTDDYIGDTKAIIDTNLEFLYKYQKQTRLDVVNDYLRGENNEYLKYTLVVLDGIKLSNYDKIEELSNFGKNFGIYFLIITPKPDDNLSFIQSRLIKRSKDTYSFRNQTIYVPNV